MINYPPLLPKIPMLRKYLAVLPEDKKSKAIIRMQRAFYVIPVREISEGHFWVTLKGWKVKLTQLQNDKGIKPPLNSTILKGGTKMVKNNKMNFLSVALYGSFPAVCTCPDFKGRDDSKIVPCKHIWACLIQKYKWDKSK